MLERRNYSNKRRGFFKGIIPIMYGECVNIACSMLQEIFDNNNIVFLNRELQHGRAVVCIGGFLWIAPMVPKGAAMPALVWYPG